MPVYSSELGVITTFNLTLIKIRYISKTIPKITSRRDEPVMPTAIERALNRMMTIEIPNMLRKVALYVDIIWSVYFSLTPASAARPWPRPIAIAYVAVWKIF
jgi:hypothetical protein